MACHRSQSSFSQNSFLLLHCISQYDSNQNSILR
jgi:hypothetical protein